MPELSRFNGIVITIYDETDGKHHVPHIHARYGEYEVSISLDGAVLAGYLPERQVRLVQSWLYLRYSEVRDAWDCMINSRKPPKIKPLR